MDLKLLFTGVVFLLIGVSIYSYIRWKKASSKEMNIYEPVFPQDVKLRGSMILCFIVGALFILKSIHV
jgi:hypothetical protein